MQHMKKEWHELVTKHKKLLQLLVKELEKEDPKPTVLDALFCDVDWSAMLLTMEYANYACQKCKTTEKLTLHHVVHRNEKIGFCDRGRYVGSRHYWNNIVVLCIPCHGVVDHHNKETMDKMKWIPEEKIEKMKYYFKKQLEVEMKQ